MTAALESKLNFEVRRGPLAQTFPLFEPDTLRHAHEAMALRHSMPNLENEVLWTADFSMYRSEGGEAFVYFAPREHNLIFRDIKNAAGQLLETGNYIPPKEGINEVVAAAAGKALKTKISDLELIKDNEEYGHFDVDPDNLDSLNAAQRQLVQAIYGNSRPGNRVYILNSEYVNKKLEGKEDSAIARASGLGRAGGGSWLDAGGWCVGDVGLLGVLKAPKAPQKIGEVPAGYNPQRNY